MRAIPVRAGGLAVFFVGLAVLPLASLMPSHMIPAFGITDTWLHGLGYGGLGIAGAWALGLPSARLREAGGRRAALKLGLALVSLGVLLELAQTIVPGRSASLGDALADALGAVLGVGLGLAAARLTTGR